MPYFDHNATTPLLPEAREAWLRACDEAWQNPGSPTRASARVHRLLSEARERFAAHVPGRVPVGRVVFTSGATEANNAIIAWVAQNFRPGAVALVSPTEHPSALDPARAWFEGRIEWMPVDTAGRPDADQVAARLQRGDVGFVVAMAANNETGVLSPVGAIAEACRAAGSLFLCDASQWIGRLPSKMLPESAFLVGCAHKFGGPKGTGFIVLPEAADEFRSTLGGGQERGHRSGTENYPAVAAMLAAFDHAEARMDRCTSVCMPRWSSLSPGGSERAEDSTLHPAATFATSDTADGRGTRARWRDRFEDAVRRAVPGSRINGAEAERLWGTTSLLLPKHDNTRWVARLDRAGFAVSTGSACSTGSGRPSHVLAAMGLSIDQVRRTIRVSAGWQTTEAEWQALAAALATTHDELECEGDTGTVVVRPPA